MIPFFFFIIVGIAQGILEWLPVSSEGQIFFISILFGGLDENTILSLAFWLHIGTMLSVLVYYKEEWILILQLKNPAQEKMRNFLIITAIGTAIIGIPMRLALLSIISNNMIGNIMMWILGFALIFTGGLIQYSKNFGQTSLLLDNLTPFQQLLIGFAQGLTIIPGVSRSGTTVSALLLFRVNSDEAFRGSFFMSVPAVLGAIALDLVDVVFGESSGILEFNVWGLIVAILLSFFLGLLTMQALILIVQKYNFAIVVVTLGVLTILFLLIF